MEDLIRILEINANHAPELFGPLHLTALIIAVSLALFVGVHFRGKKDILTYKKIMFTLGVFFILTEIWKLVIMTFPSNGEHYFRWREFPLQLSSLPMFVYLIASLTVKNERIHHTLNHFMATYFLMGGISAVAFPETLFRTPYFIPLHSLILHSVMLVVGVYLYTTGFVKYEPKSVWFKRAVMIFLGYVLVSQTIMVSAGLLGFYTPGFNGIGRMYASGDYPGNFMILGHLSPWSVSTIPIARQVQLLILDHGHLAVAYVASVITYTICCILFAYLLFKGSESVKRLYHKMTTSKATVPVIPELTKKSL